jgi:hypothetical protein
MKLLRTVLFAFALLESAAAAESASVFDVKSFGARGDRTALDTVAIQKAIDAAGAAGGGTVYFPTGDFLSGALVLRSNVTLHLTPGAVLWASAKLADYAPTNHLLFAEGVANVAITRGGTIDGQGAAFFDRDMKPFPERPAQLIEIDNSRGVRMEGVTIRHAANWTVRVRNCDDVKFRGLSLLSDLRAINTDGLQIDSSRNVLVSDCHIEGGDDCIVLKSDAQLKTGAVENVTVTNCVLVSAASALKFGTGTNREFRHCLFTNCVIRDSRTGIALMMKDGGLIEDVRFSNIVMTTLPKWGQGLEWPIVVDVERRTNASRLGHIRDVSFDGITIYSKGRILVEGEPNSPIEHISFRDVTFRVGGYEKIDGQHKPRGGPHGAADDALDYGATPAAFIFAHVRGLTLDGVTLAWPNDAKPAPRHALLLDHVADLDLRHFRAGASTPAVRAIEIRNSPGVAVEAP